MGSATGRYDAVAESCCDCSTWQGIRSGADVEAAEWSCKACEDCLSWDGTTAGRDAEIKLPPDCWSDCLISEGTIDGSETKAVLETRD